MTPANQHQGRRPAGRLSGVTHGRRAGWQPPGRSIVALNPTGGADQLGAIPAENSPGRLFGAAIDDGQKRA